MRIITLALATVFLLSGSAEAQNTHTVKQGQTLSHIAAKYGVSQSALLKANKLSSAHKLKLGQKLSIPKPAKTTKSKLVALAAPKTKKPLVKRKVYGSQW
jgi:N-acetylmuramoyl-L-alanine amidase